MMKTRWYKSFRDVANSKARSILAVLAIAIGVVGFGAVLSARSILIRELDAGYLATNPASATLWLDRIDEPLVAKIRKLPGVSQVEERRAIPGVRVRSGTNDWKNAVLFVIKDFSNITVSTLKPQNGKWPPSDEEILIERDAMGVARTKIGDDLLVKMPGGTERKLNVAGTVHDVGQAQARMEQFVYGYLSASTLAKLGEQPSFDQLKIVVSGNKNDEQHVRAVIAQTEKFIKQQGFTVTKTDIPKPGKHPHADLMDTLLLFKASFGFFALLLSGILVMNLIAAVMAGQVRQIGMMKAIGARQSQITGIYLMSVLVLGFIALLIAIPSAMVAGRTLANFMSRFLNFDLQSHAIGWPVFVFEIAAALIVPLLAALYPILKGSRVSVQAALSDYGIRETSFGSRWTDRVIASAGSFTRPFLLSLRNSFRQRARLLLIVATMAAGGAIFMAAWNVRASLIRTVDVVFSSFRYDIAISFASLYPAADVERLVRSIPEVANVESWTVVEARVPGSQDEPFNVVGAVENSKTLALRVTTGRGLKPEDTRALVINNGLASRMPGFRIGASVQLQIGNHIDQWKIVGIAHQPLASSAAYASGNYLAEIVDETGKTKTIRVIAQSQDEETIRRLKSALENTLNSARMQTTSVVAMSDRRRVIDEHNSVIYMFLIVMALLIVVVASLGLMTVMSINVLERRREIGVMRAIGATRKKVLLIILGEGSIIGFLSWILAVPISALISNALGNIAAGRILHTKLEYSPDYAGILVWLLVVLAFGGIASFFPAWSASHKTVRELVAYE